MTASDYPVYFDYGVTSWPYSVTSPHRGEDRCNVWGTPIIIGNTQIGLVGSTGKVYDKDGNMGTKAAAHLHIQEWQGGPHNTRKPQNSFKPGTVTAATSSLDFGNYVTITIDGWNTSYCHLSRIDVTVGQVIGGNMPTLVGDENIDLLYLSVLHRYPVKADKDARRGQNYLVAQQELFESDEWRLQNKVLKNPPSGTGKPLPPGVYIVEGK